MIIIGCDYHPGSQQIAYVDTETGEEQERRLGHREEAEKFYRDLATRGAEVRVGMEASGHGRWFERLLGELNIELWTGDAAKIRAKRVRKQKADREDARHILKLMLKDDFPRIWVASWDNRDLRQLLWHRHRAAARNLRRSGIPESLVKTIGGWKTTSVFHRYAIVDRRDMATAVRQLAEARAKNEHSSTIVGEFEAADSPSTKLQ